MGTVLCKHDEMVGEINEKAVKGISVKGILARAMRWRNGSAEVKRELRNSILLLTLT